MHGIICAAIFEAYEFILFGKSLVCQRRDKENSFVRITLGVNDTGHWVQRAMLSGLGENDLIKYDFNLMWLKPYFFLIYFIQRPEGRCYIQLTFYLILTLQ